MSQNDTEINGSDEQEQRGEKLVDVSEAIRYRKRAQIAEQKKQLLEQELADGKSEIEKLNKNIAQLTIERQLIDKFVLAGVKDLEAAVIIGRARIEKDSRITAEDVVEQIRKEKSYLFNETQRASISTKTSGVKDKLSTTTGVLERAAQKAVKSSSRTDLHEYLRTRRNLL